MSFCLFVQSLNTRRQRLVDPDPGQCYLQRKQASCQRCKTVSPSSPAMAAASSTNVPRDGWLKDTICLPRMFVHDCIMQHIHKSGKHSMYVEKPLEKEYRFFVENYVHNIEAVKQESFVYVRARCYRSQRKNQSPHSINIRLSDDGHVADAKCSCAAGVQGLCNHVVGLLYNVNHVTVMGLKKFPEAGTCTDNPQQWHKPRTSGIKPEPIMGYTVIRPSYSSSSNNTCGLCCTLYEARDSRVEKPDGALKSLEQKWRDIYGKLGVDTLQEF